MADNKFRLREKENAKEWQVKEQPGVHKGNTVHSYFDQYVEEDHSSESLSEDPPLPLPLPLPQAQETTKPYHPRSHPPLPDRKAFPKIGSKSALRKGTQKRAITFATERDNAAKAAFRKNEPPATTHDLGKPIKAIEPNVARIKRTFDEIGVRLGSFIAPDRSLDESKVRIWGNSRQVSLSVAELTRWKSSARIEAYTKPLTNPKFAKGNSTISQKWALDERTARRHVRRQHFQKAPEQGQQFKFNGYFLWPNDEVRATDLFGPNCEALDPLRFEFKVHIMFDEARSAFRVYSNVSEEMVLEAIQRVGNTMKEYVARDERPLTLYLIESPNTDHYRNNVQMIPGPLVGSNQTPSKIPDSCGKKLEPLDIVDWEIEAKESARKNQVIMYTAIERILQRIPFYRGHLRMRVHYGTFALIKFQWPPGAPSVPLDEFQADVQLPGTKGTLIREIQLERQAHDVLDRLHDAKNLFQSPGTGDVSLADVPPQYTAIFHLAHPDKTEEMLRLDVDFKANTSSAGFEASKANWIKGPRADGAAQLPPLEISNIRLHRYVILILIIFDGPKDLSGISWQLKISSENLVDPSRITPRMEDFANAVAFKKPPQNQYPAISGVKIFTSPTTLPILGVEQKTTFRYCLKAQPKFVIEVSRYDEYSGDNAGLPSSTQWAVSLYDREWDLRFSENARLSIGIAASWNPNANPFFEPMDPYASREANAGFTDFLLHTQAIGEFLDELKRGSQGPTETVDQSGVDAHRSGSASVGKEKKET
ncbi:MAG: hypothetical protein Q9182_005650 [Xanthomendoza sp. 2 TL-2023]